MKCDDFQMHEMHSITRPTNYKGTKLFPCFATHIHFKRSQTTQGTWALFTWTREKYKSLNSNSNWTTLILLLSNPNKRHWKAFDALTWHAEKNYMPRTLLRFKPFEANSIFYRFYIDRRRQNHSNVNGAGYTRKGGKALRLSQSAFKSLWIIRFVRNAFLFIWIEFAIMRLKRRILNAYRITSLLKSMYECSNIPLAFWNATGATCSLY